MAEAIDELAWAHESRRNMGLQGRLRVEECYSAASYGRNWDALLDKLIEESGK